MVVWQARPWLCPTLVGVERMGLYQALAGFAEQAWAGQGQVVLLAGEAGSGKTRLIRETKQLAGQRQVLQLEGACFEPDSGVPFAPLIDMLRPVPEAADLIRLLGGPATLVSDSDQHRRQLFSALLDLMHDLAGAQPLLIVVEDAHWADDASLEFVRQLARGIAARPILVLLSYRSDEAPSPLAHVLAELQRQRQAIELVLRPLSRADVDAMVQAAYPLSSGVADRIFALTEGNPFFVEEVLGALLAFQDGSPSAASLDRLPVPRTIQDAIQRRVELVSGDARQVLTLASVLGRRFDFRLLEELTAFTEVRLVSLVRELIAAGLVVEESAERFAFRHALTRQAVYAELLARERRALHLQALDALEQLHPAPARAERLEDLAFHAYAATDWPRTLEYARAAGERAAAMHAPSAAIEHFSHALEASAERRLPVPLAIVRGRGQAYETVGAFDQARSDFEMLLHAARAAVDRSAEWQALLDLAFVWSARDYARSRTYLDEALAIAQTLDDPLPLAHTLNRLGNWFMNADAPHEAASHHEQALSVFERLDDLPGTASTLDLLGLAQALCGARQRAATHYERAVQLFRQLGDRRGLASALAMLSWLGQTDPSETIVAPTALAAEAERNSEEAIDLTRAIGWRAGEAFALGQCALGPLARGDYARTLRMARDALAIADEIEHVQWALMANLDLGELHAQLLAFETATQHIERARELAQACGSEYFGRIALGNLAWVRTARGELAEAQLLLDGLAGLRSWTDPVHRWVWRVRAELQLARQQPAASLVIVDQLIESAEAAGSAPGATLPALELQRARALLDLGRVDAAATTLDKARAAAAERGLAPLLWRIESSRGLVLRRLTRRAEADVAFGAARAIIEQLADALDGAPLGEQFRLAALATLPPVPRLTPARAARQAAGGLTTREREVAALVAAGKSNAEIADTLVLGRRTIETHIANIYAKLGINSRAQVATWTVEKLRSPPEETP
jgi:DNA-binding NarL/FixJ family response regulator